MEPLIVGLTVGSLITGGFAYVMAMRYVKDEGERIRTETRRRIIDHLRANACGLTLLDGVAITDTHISAPDPVTILGDWNTISHSHFLAPEESKS